MVSLLVNVHEGQHGDEELGEPDDVEQCHDQHGQDEEDGGRVGDPGPHNCWTQGI